MVVLLKMTDLFSTWWHPGFFKVFCKNPISPHNDTAMENLALPCHRDLFLSGEHVLSGSDGKGAYTSKDGKTAKVFPEL